MSNPTRTNDVSAAKPVETKGPGRFAVPIIMGACIGAGGFLGFKASAHVGGALVGGLVAFLLARQIKEWVQPTRNETSRLPKAHLAAFLSVVAWTLLALLCRWLYPNFSSRGEGASLVLFVIILPAASFCWIVGGPSVGNLLHESDQQINAGTRPGSDRKIAKVCLWSCRAINMGFVAFLLWIALLFAS